MPVRFWLPALINADVAQLVRASLCQGEDRRFESDYPLNYIIAAITQWQSGALIRLKSVVQINLAAQKLKNALIVQLEEHGSSKSLVAGSSPAGGTI